MKIKIYTNSDIIYYGLKEILYSNQFNFELLNNIKDLANCDDASTIHIIDNVLLFDTHNIDLIKRCTSQNIVLLQTTYLQSYLQNLFNIIINLDEKDETIKFKIFKLFNNKTDHQQTNAILSEREIEVLKLIVSGYQNKEIADKLNISINTVLTHRKNISQKTGIKSVSGLTIFAVLKNIISLEETTNL